MADSDDIAALSFEKALAELERIVAELESGKTDLEQSIGAYERGSRLKAWQRLTIEQARPAVGELTET